MRLPDLHAVAAWGLLTLLTLWPLAVAAMSPLLAYRDLPYIAAGLAGTLGLVLLLFQPLLGLRALPGLSPRHARLAHRAVGAALLVLVWVHIGGLYLTSPMGTLDALLLVSPTPFSVWGVAGTVALLISALLALARHRLGLHRWRTAHLTLGLVVISGSVIHALLIEGTMGFASKLGVCAALVAVAVYGVFYTGLLAQFRRRRRR